MKNFYKSVLLLFFCFFICLDCVCAVSDSIVENDTFSGDCQVGELCSDTIEVSSDNYYIDNKVVNSSDINFTDDYSGNVVKKSKSTVKTSIISIG